MMEEGNVSHLLPQRFVMSAGIAGTAFGSFPRSSRIRMIILPPAAEKGRKRCLEGVSRFVSQCDQLRTSLTNLKNNSVSRLNFLHLEPAMMITSRLCHVMRIPLSPATFQGFSLSNRVAIPALHPGDKLLHLPMATSLTSEPSAGAANWKFRHAQPAAATAATLAVSHWKFPLDLGSPRPSEDLDSSVSPSSSFKTVGEELPLCALASLSLDGLSLSTYEVAENLPKDTTPARPWPDEDAKQIEERKSEDFPLLYNKRYPPTTVHAPGRRIVAIGDVHGDLLRAEWSLQLARVLSSDGKGRWIGGNTICVQLGDILDRGEDEIAIMSLLHNLHQQAHVMGGAVFQLNGNHETMNVEGDFRFVDPGGFEEAENFNKFCEEEHAGDCEAAFQRWYSISKKQKATRSRPLVVSWLLNPLKMRKEAATRAFLFSPGGFLARKLSQHGVVLKVNDWLFAHGGILPRHVTYGLERLNEEVSRWMSGDHSRGGNREDEIPFMAVRGYDSVVWSRLYSRDDHRSAIEKIQACAVLEKTLEAVGAKALVVGHTPQLYGANCECNGQVWRIDVGMSSGVLNAEPEVLEIFGDDAHVLTSGSYEQENNSSYNFTGVQL